MASWHSQTSFLLPDVGHSCDRRAGVQGSQGHEEQPSETQGAAEPQGSKNLDLQGLHEGEMQ